MEREIEFRGKRTDNGEWIYGSLINNENTPRIIVNSEYSTGTTYVSYAPRIKRETVGQFVGLLDKNGKKIYEGDIIKNHYGSIYVVKYFADWGGFSLQLVFLKSEGKLTRASGRQHLYKNDCNLLEVIGNIYDNKDLID